MIKPIDALTITDDFMFGVVMRDPKKCQNGHATIRE